MGESPPTIGEPHTPSFDSAMESSCHLWVYHLALIGDQCLVEFDLSSWTHLILISLCYVLGLCHSFKSCALPPSLLFHALFPEPCLSPQCCLYSLLEEQPENSWPLGGKCCIISNPSRYSGLHLPCFLQCVQQQHLSVNLLKWVTGTQCLVESICWHPFKGNGACRDNVCHFGS